MAEHVAVYARYSTDRQDARSIDDQIRRCRAFADVRGYSVTHEFKDAAQSGAHLERVDMQRMLALARQRGGSPFKALIVDDLSRLSRDLGDTWRIIFEDLAAAQVRVIDATTGMASDGAGARLTFGALALVNDTFLQLVRTETHRGLEGRAIAGFWTGGKVYGYRTEAEQAPPDPEHPRRVVLIDEAEAARVRWIFQRYTEGAGLGAIADELNRQGVPAPYDSTVAKKRGRGWGQGTIRAMLLNERYLGRFTWNKRKYVRVPGKKNRRAVLRPASEWRTTERPELAIIDAATWAVVQARFTSRGVGPKGGRPLGAGRQMHLFSGIARCGVCGAGMGVVGQRQKEGRKYITFGCTSYAHRGPAICANSLTVSEIKLNAGLVGAIRGLFASPALIARIVERFNAQLAKRLAAPDPEVARLEADLRQAELAVENLLGAVAQAGWSQALGERLKAEERRRDQLRAQRAGLQRPRAARLPGPEVVERYIGELLAALESKPDLGRELLRRHLGQVTLHPVEEGGVRSYVARGAFDLAPVVLAYEGRGAANEGPGEPEKRKPPTSEGGGSRVNRGCGGVPAWFSRMPLPFEVRF